MLAFEVGVLQGRRCAGSSGVLPRSVTVLVPCVLSKVMVSFHVGVV